MPVDIIGNEVGLGDTIVSTDRDGALLIGVITGFNKNGESAKVNRIKTCACQGSSYNIRFRGMIKYFDNNGFLTIKALKGNYEHKSYT